MIRLVLSSISAAAAYARIMRYAQWAHVLAAGLVIASGSWGPMGLSAMLFIATSAAINVWPAYRRSPFSLVLSAATALYFVLPMSFIVVLGAGYEWGAGLESVPRTQEEYAAVAPLAFGLLSILLLAAAAGLALTAGHREPVVPRLTPPLRAKMPIGLLGLLVIVLTQQAAATFLRTRLSGTETAQSLWEFIFFDHAYLMLLPLVIYRRLAVAGRRRSTPMWQFAFLLGFFVLQATIGSTSKGFILTAAILSFLLPIAVLQRSRVARCLMPSPAALWMGVLVSLWVFVLAEAWRLVVFSGQSAGLAGVLSVLKAQLADFSITRIIATVAYRLSTALDRYVLIVDAHLFAHSTAYAVSFASYLVRSFLNLVLPGTPYLDAYTPSSNLLPLVLTGQPLVGAATKAELIVSLNTQPYTMYGVAVLLLGKGAPFLIFTMTAAVGLFYRMVHSVSARLALMYLFFAGIHVYGFEVAAANAIHLAVSLYIFIWLMRGWLVARGWFVVRKAAPAVEALAREDTWGTSTH